MLDTGYSIPPTADKARGSYIVYRIIADGGKEKGLRVYQTLSPCVLFCAMLFGAGLVVGDGDGCATY